jgi:hypothetical protein
VSLKVIRHRPAGVVPLEVWDLPLGGQPLYRSLGSLGLDGLSPEARRARLPGLLGEAVALIRASGRAPAFESVVVSGGWAADPGLALPPPLRRAADPVHGGLAAARALLGPLGGVYLDLGQTALKVVSPSGARRVARDLRAHPLRLVEAGPLPPHELDAARVRLVDWLLSEIPAGTARAVLSLPCELGDEGQPGGCTYAGLGGDFVGALQARAQLDATVWLASDAELAGASARLETAATAGLALTVGFGPGAAWFHRES